ncbi:PREDICTED: uncharacterized protein LOC109147102 [Ipomoea nil]|uniref:uncharacterized protein LOC109147102 n=1 Tax=Ipomoea nil TaxID=35883 RepID=UPI0009010B11|nr:PREDICTED: uncharacterized protein LOC109147102 [Ipomoea nil]
MVQQATYSQAATSSGQNQIPNPIRYCSSDRGFYPNDLTNPLHLHPNESPTLQLVTVQLEGRSNYHSWARAMEMALRSKNKMSFRQRPSHSVLWINSAEGVWKDLNKRFSQQDVFRIAEIQSQIYQIRQGNSTINEYITQLKLLWDELLVLRPIPNCECSPTSECRDKLSEKVKTHLENDMMSAFLTGLNDNYTTTKRQIMLMKPLPDVDNRRNFPNQKQKLMCSYCGYTGHTVEKCYKKHGYPPGWKPRNKGSSVNTVQSSMEEGGSSETCSPFTQEDCRRFLEFLQQERTRTNTPLDLNLKANVMAANFIPKAIRLQTNAMAANFIPNAQYEVQGNQVDLPNGHYAEVSHIGSVHLSTNLILENDQHLGKMIGLAKLKKGLYHLVFPVSAQCNFVDFPVANTCSFCSSIANNCFDLVHADVWGYYHVPTIYGHQYFLTLVDDHSRSTWVYLMRKKSEVRQIIQCFYELIKTQFGKVIICVRSDNGKEFLMENFYQTRGIIHQTSCVYTPQQNSIVERKHGHILSIARALRFQVSLPKQFWGDCILHAVYLINKIPSAVLGNQIPYQILFGKVPQYQHLNVFGCLAFASIPNYKRDKFSPRARRCIFLGFANGVKGYKLFDIQTKEVLLSRDVSFYENIFPLQDSHDKQPFDMLLPSEGISNLKYDEDTSLHNIEAPSDDLPGGSPDVPIHSNGSNDTNDAEPSSEPRRSTKRAKNLQ